jgi:hypothetical protein
MAYLLMIKLGDSEVLAANHDAHLALVSFSAEAVKERA